MHQKRPKGSSDYTLFTIHYSLFIEPHVSEAFLAFHFTFDTIIIAVDERQQKHPSFSF